MRSLLILLSLAILSHTSFAQDNPEIKPIAPYSPAVITASGMLFISGQIPIDPETGKLHKGDVQKETKIVMKRIGILLEIYPAREAIEVSNLPLGASIEISAIASK